jgi:hypothetical protein
MDGKTMIYIKKLFLQLFVEQKVILKGVDFFIFPIDKQIVCAIMPHNSWGGCRKLR